MTEVTDTGTIAGTTVTDETVQGRPDVVRTAAPVRTRRKTMTNPLQVQVMTTTVEVASRIAAPRTTTTTTGAVKNPRGGVMTAVVTIGKTVTRRGPRGMPTAAKLDGRVD
jgi:hypothetical protein